MKRHPGTRQRSHRPTLTIDVADDGPEFARKTLTRPDGVAVTVLVTLDADTNALAVSTLLEELAGLIRQNPELVVHVPEAVSPPDWSSDA